MSNDDDQTWVEVRRLDDALNAHMLCEFLRAQGIPARVRGSGAGSGILNRFSSIVDLRLVVPPGQRQHAASALLSYDSGELAGEIPVEATDPTAPPYRGAQGAAHEASPLRRSGAAAALLAMLVPVGGGHFYTRHHGTAFVLAGSVLALGLVGHALDAPWLYLGAVFVVLGDMLLAPFAARRVNQQRISSMPTQLGAGLTVSAAALGLAWLLTGGEKAPAPELPAAPLRAVAS